MLVILATAAPLVRPTRVLPGVFGSLAAFVALLVGLAALTSVPPWTLGVIGISGAVLITAELWTVYKSENQTKARKSRRASEA
jgi:hypothetical protein